MSCSQCTLGWRVRCGCFSWQTDTPRPHEWFSQGASLSVWKGKGEKHNFALYSHGFPSEDILYWSSAFSYTTWRRVNRIHRDEHLLVRPVWMCLELLLERVCLHHPSLNVGFSRIQRQWEQPHLVIFYTCTSTHLLIIYWALNLPFSFGWPFIRSFLQLHNISCGACVCTIIYLTILILTVI